MFETRNWITGSNTDVLDCSAHWKRHYFLQALDDVFLNLCWICTKQVCDCKNKSHIFTIQGPRTEKEYIFAFGLVEKGTSQLLVIYKVQQMSCKEKNLSSCVISQEEKYTFLKKKTKQLFTIMIIAHVCSPSLCRVLIVCISDGEKKQNLIQKKEDSIWNIYTLKQRLF